MIELTVKKVFNGSNLELHLLFLKRFNMTNFSSELDKNQEVYFQGLFERRPSFWFVLVLSFCVCCLCCILSFGIVWFEKFGSDSRRTLINKLVSSIYFTTMVELPLIYVFEAFRFFYGPYPQFACYLFAAVKNSLKWQALLLLDLIMISKYLFGFWLKNPAAVKVF